MPSPSVSTRADHLWGREVLPPQRLAGHPLPAGSVSQRQEPDPRPQAIPHLGILCFNDPRQRSLAGSCGIRGSLPRRTQDPDSITSPTLSAPIDLHRDLHRHCSQADHHQRQKWRFLEVVEVWGNRRSRRDRPLGGQNRPPQGIAFKPATAHLRNHHHHPHPL